MRWLAGAQRRRAEWHSPPHQPTWLFCDLDNGEREAFAVARRIVGRLNISFRIEGCDTLHNFEPAASEDEVRAAAFQYVRKISGFTKPSHANQDAFDTDHAVDEIAHLTGHLLEALITTAPPKDREEVAAKRKALAVQRFGPA